MLMECLILAAVLGQATQPATPAEVTTRPAVVTATEESATSGARRAPTFRVAAADNARDEVDAREPAESKRPNITTGGRSAPTTQPAADMAQVADVIGTLSGDPIEIQAASDGTILISANPHDMKILERLLNQMDTPPEGGAKTFRIFTLESAQATDVARQVQGFWNDYKKPAAGRIMPQDTLSITPDPRANLLMVATTEDNMVEVEQIIKLIDVPVFGQDDTDFTPIQLENRKVTEAEQMLREMLTSIAAQRGISKDLVRIIADIPSNTLLVSAPEADLEQIRRFIELIDVEPTEAAGSVVRVAFVQLKKAVARDLADALNDILATETDAAKAMEEQIRRMQITLVEEGKDLPPVNLEKPIKILAEPGTNAIVIASVESNLIPLLEIVKLLDTQPTTDDLMIKIFPLHNADAETLQTNLQRVFDTGRQLPKVPGKEVAGRIAPGVEGSLSYEISIVADVRTNTLIVSGRPEQLLLAQQIVEAVDADKSANKFPVRMIHLENADVRRVREAVQQLADQREQMAEGMGQTAEDRERILLIDDVRTNNLIIVANDENYRDMADLARQLDETQPDWLGDIKILSVDRELAASDLADKIEDLWDRRADLRREGGLPEDRPVIVTDTRSNSLVIASNKEDYAEIVRLVDQLKALPVSPMMDIYDVRLEHAEAGELAQTIQELFDQRLEKSIASGEEPQPTDRVFITHDPVTNLLLAVSSKSNYQEILRLLSKLDIPPTVDGKIRTFFVKNIDVTQAEEIIREMFDEGINRGMATDRGELPESMTKVTLVSDVRSSALIVSASEENYAIVQKILDEIDRVDVPVFQTDARFFTVQHADVVNAADILDQLLEGMRAPLGDQSDQLEYTIITDTSTRRLAVVGTRFAMKKAEELIARIDVPDRDPTSQMVVYPLEHASPLKLQEMMTELFDQRETEAGEATPITILADAPSRSLIVDASQPDHQIVESLLRELDQVSKASEQMEIFALKDAKAEQIQDRLADLLEEVSGDTEMGFSVTAEPRTNSLLIWAPPDMMRQIREIVQKLDNAKPKAELALRVIKLYNARADELADLLNEFFEDAGAGEGDDAKQLIINFLAGIRRDTGEEVYQDLVHQDVTIAADENTNALLVLAPEDNIGMMQMLIEMLDSVEPETLSIKVFELYNADASEMQTLLEGLFESEDREGARRIALAEGGMAGAAGGDGAALELAFEVDERTNSLIVAGTPSHLRMVEALVYSLDQKEMEERVAKVVRLRHRKASDVVTTLQEYFDEESQVLEEAAGEEAASRQAKRQVIITEAAVEDSESNTVLLSYSPMMESHVIRMINELDQPVPQVMIQVLMAEVTLTDNFELGMEFAIQELLFSEQAVINPSTGLPQGPDFDFVFGTDVGAAGTGGLGGISFTMNGEDFAFLFRALQSDGRVEILSRPQIMVQDGQDAEINIVEQVPVVTDVAVSGTGVVTPSVNYVDVGIQLSVTPLINYDGYVNMHVEPEISAIAQSSVSIGAGITLPIFSSRNAITDVTVKDGETVIIGGLITNQENSSESKAPILGDVPGVGALFRSTAQSTTKTELLIVLTPHVVRVADDAVELSKRLRDLTGLNENIRHSPLMGGLQVKPNETFGPEGEQGEPENKRPGGPTVEEEEELGPALEEYGPSAAMIRLGNVEPAVAVLPEDK